MNENKKMEMACKICGELCNEGINYCSSECFEEDGGFKHFDTNRNTNLHFFLKKNGYKVSAVPDIKNNIDIIIYQKGLTIVTIEELSENTLHQQQKKHPVTANFTPEEAEKLLQKCLIKRNQNESN